MKNMAQPGWSKDVRKANQCDVTWSEGPWWSAVCRRSQSKLWPR